MEPTADATINFEETFMAANEVIAESVCENCGQPDSSVMLRRGNTRLCWQCYKKQLEEVKNCRYWKEPRCAKCGKTEGLKKVYLENVWYCLKHFPKHKKKHKQEARPRILYACDVCGTLKGVRKYSGKEEWYCKEHWPARKIAGKPKQPCKECGTREKTRKYRGKDEWYCSDHWPPRKKPAKPKHPCHECGTTEGVRKYTGKKEWYCKKHWPSRRSKQKIFSPLVCHKCGSVIFITQIKLTGELICWKCAEINHVCLICGDEMVEIGRHEKHYICVRARNKNGHKDVKSHI
ncbi:MAG TPA: hypothetical protein P5080_05980 [Candidatus Paceibacterota bacterium]|nr:hypothetical protein [Candidatus Pacearchaeota archaeon]HRZ51482.1 hypothetical protein [Candidatus Paceibacterota bacterium]HSA37216.1 hypothetical protein [Candidatus Paceibacterota bacterium]